MTLGGHYTLIIFLSVSTILLRSIFGVKVSIYTQQNRLPFCASHYEIIFASCTDWIYFW